MPFGFCNTPATFQRLMERVLSGLHWETCLVYIDNIIIFSSSVEDHFLRLRKVFSCLKAAGLKLKPAKCHLLRKSVKYLGHIVSADGIKTDPEKTQCIAKWPQPANQTELKQFLGLALYYRRFVKNFAQEASPLHQLTQKDRKWTGMRNVNTFSSISSICSQLLQS